MRPQGRLRRKTARIFPPREVERNYLRFMRGLVFTLRDLTRDVLLPHLTTWVREIEELESHTRTDAFDPNEIEEVLDRLVLEFDRRYSPQTIREAARALTEQTASHSRRQIERAVSSMFGNEFVFGPEPYLSERVAIATAENFNLIKSIPDQYRTRLNNALFSNLRAGEPITKIMSDVQHSYMVTRRRAANIAIDQVSKFHGEIDRERFLGLGFKKYIWRTQKDDRVRPEHEAREGKIYLLTSHPIPGVEINCRCWAEPVEDD